MAGFYHGIESHLLSRIGYLAIRNLLYKIIYDAKKPVKPTNDLSTREKAVIAALSGGIAAFVTTPFELVNLR